MYSNDEIKVFLANIEATFSKSYAKALYDKPLFEDVKEINREIQKLNALFSITDSETQLNFDIGDLTQEAITLGYKLYRMQDYIVSRL